MEHLDGTPRPHAHALWLTSIGADWHSGRNYDTFTPWQIRNANVVSRRRAAQNVACACLHQRSTSRHLYTSFRLGIAGLLFPSHASTKSCSCVSLALHLRLAFAHRVDLGFKVALSLSLLVKLLVGLHQRRMGASHAVWASSALGFNGAILLAHQCVFGRGDDAV